MWAVARRPRWIAALAFALLLAAGFAALSQWQLARSVATGTVIERSTESPVSLETISKPQSPMTDRASAQMVTATGRFVPGDYSLVSDRLNSGTEGWWVVGHFSAVPASGSPVGLVVALGWAPDKAAATSALSALDDNDHATVTITGRYLPDEGPQDSDFEHGKVSTMSAGAFLNLWKNADAAGIYPGYLVSSDRVAGLSLIDSPRPSSDVEVNLLNIFYAIEWVVFAGFAIFLWFRLVKDAWDREQEEAAEAAEEAALREAPDHADVN